VDRRTGLRLAGMGLLAGGATFAVVAAVSAGPAGVWWLASFSACWAASIAMAFGRRPDRPVLVKPGAVTTDGRPALPLAHRRKLWLVGAGIWTAGWIVALTGLWVVGSHAPAFLRLGIFLVSIWGAVALGSAWMRRTLGSTRWPH